jgi:potassium-transporting ATPase KdpC subunit
MRFGTRSLKQLGVSIRAMIVLTVVLGLGYTLVITGVGQFIFPAQSNGSAITVGGKTVGSSLIGQSFTNSKGVALPQWFQSRPSAAGAGYDATESSGSNYGPNSSTLVALITGRQKAIESSDGVSPSQIPADAVTASGSGLDPDISPAYALIQVNRVAKARGLSASVVKKLVESKIQGRELGYLGEPTVNVVELNLALAKLG